MRMLIPNWTNRSLASEVFDEMDRFFDDWNTSKHAVKVYDERTFDPACDVFESGDHYMMSVDLPGIKKENIKIEISDNILTVSGERKRESTDKNQRIQRFEKSYGFFKRSFTLPSSVETESVEARYEDGVLELYLPKIAAAKPRCIEIQSGKSGIFSKLLGGKKNNQEIKDVNSTAVT